MTQDEAETPRAGVDFICVNAEHIALGMKVPDGGGTLTVNGRGWAYCSAGLLNAEHDWKSVASTPFSSIRHADLDRESAP